MDSTDSSNEGDPLKRGQDGVEVGTAAPATELRRKSCKEALGLSKFNHWRTAIFFLSLFLCLTIVFAFSFIIPCPVRPQYLAAWNRTFIGAATYDFLAIDDTSRDKVMDIMFVVKDSNVSQEKTCEDAGLPSPCLFIIAVDGTDGVTLWERELSPDFHWAQCGLDKDTNRDWSCLISHSDQLSAIDKYKGVVRWQQPRPPSLSTSTSVLNVPDLDGDHVNDVALISSENPTPLLFISGKTGVQIGMKVDLNSMEGVKVLLHHTKQGSHYLLLRRDTGLYGLALWRIATAASVDSAAGLKKDKTWEGKANATTGLVPFYMSDSVRQVVRKGTNDASHLLIVTAEEVALIDGQNLKTLWRYNSSLVLREPTFGHYNKDGVLDVVIEEDVGNLTRRILILDGNSGRALWEVSLRAEGNSPRPSSINTVNLHSIFMFWGVFSQDSSSVLSPDEYRTYLLNPLHSKVLLESSNVVDNIVASRATLLESGRHAAYILLTKPGTNRTDGAVVLSKWKVKQDVPDSRVLHIGDGMAASSDKDIKEAFNRLRFSDENEDTL